MFEQLQTKTKDIAIAVDKASPKKNKLDKVNA